MRKVFFFTTLSLDGYFEGPNHDISWHNVDSDFNEFAIEQLKEADIIMFGRRAYQLMENSWPKIANDTTTSEQNLEVARLINNINKIVFSRTMNKIEERENWRNVKLVRNFDPREIERLKKQPGFLNLANGSPYVYEYSDNITNDTVTIGGTYTNGTIVGGYTQYLPPMVEMGFYTYGPGTFCGETGTLTAIHLIIVQIPIESGMFNISEATFHISGARE